MLRGAISFTMRKTLSERSCLACGRIRGEMLGTVSILGKEIGGGYVLGVLLGAAVITLVTFIVLR